MFLRKTLVSFYKKFSTTWNPDNYWDTNFKALYYETPFVLLLRKDCFVKSY